MTVAELEMLRPRGMAWNYGNPNNGLISGIADSSDNCILTEVRRPTKRPFSGSSSELEPAIKQEKLDSGYDQAASNQTVTLLGTVGPNSPANIPRPVTAFTSPTVFSSRTSSQPIALRGRPFKSGNPTLTKNRKFTSRNRGLPNRPVILLPHGGVAAPHPAPIPMFFPRRPLPAPNIQLCRPCLAPAATTAPVVVLAGRPSVPAARIVWTGVAPTIMTSSAFSRPVVRLQSIARPNGIQLGSGPQDRLKSIIGKSVLDKYVGKDPPTELHMPARSKRICQGCGDEFITNVGLVDHISRRSMVLSFHCTCKLGKWPRLFYNPCMFESFYRSHCARPGIHVPRDSVVISALDLDTPEYRSCLAARSQQNGTAASDSCVSRSSENPNSQQLGTSSANSNNQMPVRTTDDCNSKDSHCVPTEASVKEVYINVEIEPDGQRNDHLVASGNAGKSPMTGARKKGNENCVTSVANSRNGRQRQMSAADSSKSLSSKAADFFSALCRNRTKCCECTVQYKTRRWLSLHFTQCRTEQLECDKCGLKLPTACGLNAHLRLHDVRPPFVCPRCGIVFDEAESVDVFKAHVERQCLHFLPSSSSIISSNCPRCSFNMPQANEATMAQHFVDAHTTVYYKCRNCPKAFANESVARKHSENTGHCAEKDIVRKCSSCDVVFKECTGTEMQLHVMEHLETVKSSVWHCPVCPGMVDQPSHIVVHMRFNHPELILPATTCEVCGHPCANQVELFMHVSTQHVSYFESVMKCLPSPSGKKSASIADDKSRLEREPLVGNAATVNSTEIPVSESESTLAEQSSVTSLDADVEPSPSSESDVLGSISKAEPSVRTPVSDVETLSASESEIQSSMPKEVFDCSRCQMEFNSEDVYKRHQAKHRFLESKRARKKQKVAQSSGDPLQQVFWHSLLRSFVGIL